MVVRTCGHERLFLREWEGLVIVNMGLIKTVKDDKRRGVSCGAVL